VVSTRAQLAPARRPLRFGEQQLAPAPTWHPSWTRTTSGGVHYCRIAS